MTTLLTTELAVSVTTLDNRRLTGLVAEANEASVTLVNVIENKQVKTVVSKKDIEFAGYVSHPAIKAPVAV